MHCHRLCNERWEVRESGKDESGGQGRFRPSPGGGVDKRYGGKKEKGKEEKRCGNGVWDERGRNVFKQKLGRMELGGREIGEEPEEMRGRLREAIRETEKELDKRMERKEG